MRWFAPLLVLSISPLAALQAKTSLGVFDDWGAFRDARRCYAIAMPETLGRSALPGAFASVGTWPDRGVRGQLHIRLSRETAKGARIRLRIGRQSFVLTGSGRDAWARDKGMDAAILAAMRSNARMRVSSVSITGRPFSDTIDLEGAASAMDAATLGCAPRRR